MALNWQKPGINHVGEYQISGQAFAVQSDTNDKRIDLKFVASGVTVCNANAGAKVTFFDSQNAGKDVILGAAGSHNFNVKFIRLQLTGSSGNIGAVCQLTNISADNFATLPHASMGTVAT